MAKWIGEAWAVELIEDSNNDNGNNMQQLVGNSLTPKWKLTTLAVLFSGMKQPPSWLLPVEIDAESTLMQALAEIEGDEWPDNGEVEMIRVLSMNHLKINHDIYLRPQTLIKPQELTKPDLRA
jgi:hypothetical protein